MTTVDYLIVALIAVSAIVGLLRGFLREVIALLTWVAALLIAWHFGRLLEPYLGGLLAAPHVRPWAARVILLVAVLLVGAGIGAIVVSLTRLALFYGVDRLLGFFFGLLRGIVVFGVLVLFCQTLRLDSERWWHESILIPYGEDAASMVRGLVGEVLVRSGATRLRGAFGRLHLSER
ncbi:MAG TPA: CvpA family protein [Steroidobacteraceae bacterium]|nr:CvpA family protein [Steroidobacteraceae bacterium]